MHVLFLFGVMRAIYPAHLLLDLSILIFYGKEQELRNFSLPNFLHSPATSPLLGSNIVLSPPFSLYIILYSYVYKNR
jgi:hypothetical protein